MCLLRFVEVGGEKTEDLLISVLYGSLGVLKPKIHAEGAFGSPLLIFGSDNHRDPSQRHGCGTNG